MTDLRVRRTRFAIKQAFIDLVNEKGFESVSVTEIADQAMINRLTFYKHYTDKYDLAQKLIEDFGNEYRQIIERRGVLSEENLSFEKILELMTPEVQKIFTKRGDEIRALRSIQIGNITLQSEIQKVLSQNIKQIVHHDTSNLENMILSSFIVTVINYSAENKKAPDFIEIRRTFEDILEILKIDD